MSIDDKLALVSGSTCPEIAQEIAKILDERKLLPVKLALFPNSDPDTLFEDTVRGRVVFFIQTSLTGKTAENLFETLAMADAAFRAGAKAVKLVQLLYPASRQDRREPDENGKPKRRPITARIVADSYVKVAGINSVVTVHLHAGQIEGFFKGSECTVENISSTKIFIEYLRRENVINGDKEGVMLCAADAGGTHLVSPIARFLGLNYAIVDKRRIGAGQNEVMHVIGDVEDKIVIIWEDIVDSGGTAVKAADALLAKGAKEVILVATHAVLTGNAVNRLIDSSFKKIIFTNTVPPLKEVIERPDRFTVLSMGPLLADVIANIFNDKSFEEVVRLKLEDSAS